MGGHSTVVCPTMQSMDVFREEVCVPLLMDHSTFRSSLPTTPQTIPSEEGPSFVVVVIMMMMMMMMVVVMMMKMVTHV